MKVRCGQRVTEADFTFLSAAAQRECTQTAESAVLYLCYSCYSLQVMITHSILPFAQPVRGSMPTPTLNGCEEQASRVEDARPHRPCQLHSAVRYLKLLFYIQTLYMCFTSIVHFLTHLTPSFHSEALSSSFFGLVSFCYSASKLSASVESKRFSHLIL